MGLCSWLSLLFSILSISVQVSVALPSFVRKTVTTPWKQQQRIATFWNDVRGGDSIEPTSADVSTESATTTEDKEEPSLDDKVHAAMRKLGLTPPSPVGRESNDSSSTEEQTGIPEKIDGELEEECKDGVCPVPSSSSTASPNEPIDANELGARLAKEMGVHQSLAMAAIGATSELLPEGRLFHEDAARDMIQQELDYIKQVSDDSDEVKQLVSEGYDEFLSRRALAFAEMNIDDARAILLADQQDEEEEVAKASEQNENDADDEESQIRAKLRAEMETKQQQQKPVQEMKTVTVETNFDPTAPTTAGNSAGTSSTQSSSMNAPPPAQKKDVVFEATSAQVQELVLESPVPVLLDVYADWCGPCKALTPILEEMAVKAGGMFRLVKINTDNEKAITGAMEVTALPSVFGIRDGKVVHMFQGMPSGEEAMKNFMMGLLIPGQNFNPPVSKEQQQKYDVISSKLVKAAGAACFSFSARERLQDRTQKKLNEIVEAYNGDMVDAEDSAKVLRSLLSNVIRNPHEVKFRKINLSNKVISAKVASFPACISILKSIGFTAEGNDTLILGKDKKIVNVAPLLVVRDCIDKWIDKNRYLVAAAARKRKDEIERARLAAEAEAAESEEEEDDDCESEEVDPNLCTIKLRVEGKKKVHSVEMNADDPISTLLDDFPVDLDEGNEVQLTCAAKRLIVKSKDKESMSKSFRQHGLMPISAIVVKILVDSEEINSSKAPASRLSDRAAAKKNRKRGSHTMQSIGIYSKDDNNKAELIDGGGGVWYEHDVSDHEEEKEDLEKTDEANETVDNAIEGEEEDDDDDDDDE